MPMPRLPLNGVSDLKVQSVAPVAGSSAMTTPAVVTTNMRPSLTIGVASARSGVSTTQAPPSCLMFLALIWDSVEYRVPAQSPPGAAHSFLAWLPLITAKRTVSAPTRWGDGDHVRLTAGHHVPMCARLPTGGHSYVFHLRMRERGTIQSARVVTIFPPTMVRSTGCADVPWAPRSPIEHGDVAWFLISIEPRSSLQCHLFAAVASQSVSARVSVWSLITSPFKFLPVIIV